jgi:hypothetical protein
MGAWGLLELFPVWVATFPQLRSVLPWVVGTNGNDGGEAWSWCIIQLTSYDLP